MAAAVERYGVVDQMPVEVLGQMHGCRPFVAGHVPKPQAVHDLGILDVDSFITVELHGERATRNPLELFLDLRDGAARAAGIRHTQWAQKSWEVLSKIDFAWLPPLRLQVN
jgi:hypothetical protein